MAASKRLTQREKRMRARARAEIREAVKKAHARVAAARAEEPVLAAHDRRFGEFQKTWRECQRFAKKNALSLMAIIGTSALGHGDECDCLVCEAAELDGRVRAALDALAAVSRRREEIEAANARVSERLRLEREREFPTHAPTANTGEKR